MYKAEIETVLSEEVGAPVNIANMRATLNGFMPELGLYQLQIAAANKKTAVQLKEIQIGIDIFKLIYKPWIESLKINLVGAKLSVKRLESGEIAIAGLPSRPENDEAPRWLLQANQYKIIDSEIEWEDKKRHAKKILLKHVNMTVKNEGLRHKIAINAVLPENLGAALSLKMDFTGDIFTAKSVNARFFAHGLNINFSEIASGDLPFNFSFVRGRGDFSLWSHWQETQMVDLSGSIQLRNGLLQSKSTKQKELHLDKINLNLKLQKQDGWKLAIENSQLSSHGISLRIPKLALSLQQNDEGELTKFAANVPYLNLGHISKVINRNSLLPKAIKGPAKEMGLEGVVSSLKIVTDLEEATFSIDGVLRKLSFKGYKGVPGVQNLALSLQGTESAGKINLAAEQVGLHFHHLFRAPLYFKQAKGDVFWRKQENSWQLSSAAVQLNTQDIKTKSRFDLLLPADKTPAEINLQSYFYESRNARTVLKYLPVGIMHNKVVTWLDHAFLGGDIDQGAVVLRGPFKGFPYTDQQGVFEVLFDAQRVDLHYGDGWENIQDIDAKIRFFANSFTADISKGTANKATIKTAHIAIDSLTTSDYLTIEGEVDAELSGAINFLKNSPFNKEATQLDRYFAMQGDAALKLDLSIPLRGATTKASVDVVIKNAAAEVLPSHIQFKQLNAVLHITEDSIVSDSFNAEVFSFPIEGRINSDTNNIYADLTGAVNIEQLANYQQNDFWQYAKGETKYQVSLQVPKNTEDVSRLKISSDLKGIDLEFAPFAKTAEQENQLSTEIYMNEAGVYGAHFIYDNQISVKNSLDINIKQIDSNWQGLFYSPFAQGSFFSPVEKGEPVQLGFKLERLDLSALAELNSKPSEKSNARFLVNKLPEINLESKETFYQDQDYGVLNLQTAPMEEGLVIKNVSLSSTESQLKFSGEWLQKEQDKTRITGTFEHKNLGRLLKDLDLSENLYKSYAEFKFDFNWGDAPHKVSNENISGMLNANLADGRLLAVEPGLGRILGGLDTWKLMDRLKFDFSDIALEGLSYTELSGDLTLNKGKVATDKLYINAMPAQINISGETHLATKELSLKATVLPKFPIAGTIIGKIANSVTEAIVGDEHAAGLLLSLQYDIAGTWDEVEVERLFMPFQQNQSKKNIKPVNGVIPAQESQTKE